jgi:hypothetical protein
MAINRQEEPDRSPDNHGGVVTVNLMYQNSTWIITEDDGDRFLTGESFRSKLATSVIPLILMSADVQGRLDYLSKCL